MSLDDLAKISGYTRHQISSIFNQGRNVTFFDLIKDYRVKEYQRLCREPAMSGSGLGLSIVREIMRLHGSSCKIANCTGGVCATVRFPV